MTPARRPSRRQASALLVILLVMAALGSLLLYISRDALGSGRQAASFQAGDSAEQAARAAIEEGVVRYAGSLGLGWGEYGNGADANEAVPASAYSLEPLVRGYQPDTGCSALAGPVPADQLAAIDTACPYYYLSVRTHVRLNDAASSFSVDPSLLPSGTAVTLSIEKPAALPFWIRLGDLGSGASAATVTASAGGSTMQLLPGGSSFQVPAGAAALTLTAAGALTGRGVYLDTDLSRGMGDIVMDRGGTQIEAVGVAGSVRRGYLVTIPAYDTTKRLVTPLSSLFDAAGLPR